MISLDFSVAIALYVFLFTAPVLFFWAFCRRQKDKEAHLEARFIWFCSVCTYNYVDTKEEVISVCPRCGSYNKK